MLKFDLKTGGKYKGCMAVCTYHLFLRMYEIIEFYTEFEGTFLHICIPQNSYI